MLGRHAGLEGHAVRLRRRVAVAMLDEEQSLAFGEGGAQVGRFADQPGLALLADAALEHRLDEDELVPIDEVLDLSLGRGGTEDLGDRKIDVPHKRRAVKKAGELHGARVLFRLQRGSVGAQRANSRLAQPPWLADPAGGSGRRVRSGSLPSARRRTSPSRRSSSDGNFRTSGTTTTASTPSSPAQSQAIRRNQHIFHGSWPSSLGTRAGLGTGSLLRRGVSRSALRRNSPLACENKTSTTGPHLEQPLLCNPSVGPPTAFLATPAADIRRFPADFVAWRLRRARWRRREINYATRTQMACSRSRIRLSDLTAIATSVTRRASSRDFKMSPITRL